MKLWKCPHIFPAHGSLPTLPPLHQEVKSVSCALETQQAWMTVLMNRMPRGGAVRVSMLGEVRQSHTTLLVQHLPLGTRQLTHTQRPQGRPCRSMKRELARGQSSPMPRPRLPTMGPASVSLKVLSQKTPAPRS